MIGKALAHYEITFQIGKGGMGEVYQEKDTKLGRDVAIKVLPEEFMYDHERVARTLDPSKKILGVEGARQHIKGVRQTFPDLYLTIEKQISEGDWVVTCITAQGSDGFNGS